VSGQALRFETAEWPGGWLQIKVPLPFALKWVNSYLIPDGKGWTLVDPGLHTPEAADGWTALLAELGLRFGDIARIVLTHQHPDHYGLAGWFQQRSGAPVLMSRAAHAYAMRLWGESRRFGEELTRLYAAHGMPGELLATIGPHLESFVERVSPQPEVTYLEGGGTIGIGGLTWDIAETPGHASGHLVFYQRGERLMLCGDQVLPDITPNISVVPGDDERPLRSYLDSLRRLAAYEVRLAFPGHRNPFTDFAGRLAELVRHHERRLEEIGGWLAEGPLTGYETCVRMFGVRIGGNPHNLRFAMSETLAHLYELEAAGSVRGCRVDADGANVIRYERAD